jgi:hypothetical protein
MLYVGRFLTSRTRMEAFSRPQNTSSRPRQQRRKGNTTGQVLVSNGRSSRRTDRGEAFHASARAPGRSRGVINMYVQWAVAGGRPVPQYRRRSRIKAWWRRRRAAAGNGLTAGIKWQFCKG